ncbi:MAG: hypothetical protein K2L24_02880 [Opitutales bacterium]|nr:hypothetical protein [Opitutales bacterium]
MTVPSVTAPDSTPTPAPAPSTDKAKEPTTEINNAKKSSTAGEQIEKQLKEKALPEANKQLTELAKKSLDPVKKEAAAVIKTLTNLIKDIKTYLGLKFPRAAAALSDFQAKHPILMGLFKVATAVTAFAIPIVASVFASIAIDSFPLTAAVSLGVTMFLLPHARGALEKLDTKIKSKIETLKAEQAEQEKAAQEAAQKASATKEVEAKDASKATPPEVKDAANPKPEAAEAAKPKDSETLEKKEPMPAASAEKPKADAAESKKPNADDRS